jgi:hypothetical protein
MAVTRTFTQAKSGQQNNESDVLASKEKTSVASVRPCLVVAKQHPYSAPYIAATKPLN